MSDRAIAKAIGVDHKTVGKARRETTGDDSPVERIGLDGKTRKLPQRTPKEFYSEPSDDSDDDDERGVTAIWLRIDAAKELAAVHFPGEVTQELVRAARAVAAAWEELAQNMERKL
jgi:hypothetical protein